MGGRGGVRIGGGCGNTELQWYGNRNWKSIGGEEAGGRREGRG